MPCVWSIRWDWPKRGSFCSKQRLYGFNLVSSPTHNVPSNNKTTIEPSHNNFSMQREFLIVSLWATAPEQIQALLSLTSLSPFSQKCGQRQLSRIGLWCSVPDASQLLHRANRSNNNITLLAQSQFNAFILIKSEQKGMRR